MNVMTTATPAVELLSFAKSYRLGWIKGPCPAVQALTLRLAPGQVLGLLGPNGSGKSTTLKALAGLLMPTSGQCRIFGQPAGGDAARALIGYLPEATRFSPHLSGREFLHFCAGLSSMDGEAARQRVDEVLTWSGLKGAGEQRLATYSKGMAQRIGLAQAILHDPALVLLDEPASGLDPEGRLALNVLIRDLAARGRTVVFSSHLLDEAAALCDRIALLAKGRLLAEGTPEELLGVGIERMPQASRLETLYLEKLHQHA